jgi:hypothetical protein
MTLSSRLNFPSSRQKLLGGDEEIFGSSIEVEGDDGQAEIATL